MENDKRIKETLSENILKSEKLLHRRKIEEITFNGLLDKLTSMIANVLTDDN